MTDPVEPIQRLMDSGLWEEIWRSQDWAARWTYPCDFELFLNPADTDGLTGGELLGMPVRQSIGVPQGRCLIFDRRRGVYIRRGEKPA